MSKRIGVIILLATIAVVSFDAANVFGSNSHTAASAVAKRGPITPAVSKTETEQAPNYAALGLNQINFTSWDRFITDHQAGGQPWDSNGRGGSGSGTAYNAAYFSPSNVALIAGGLGTTITATPGTTAAGYSWTSGVLNSYGVENFDGGYFQFEARVSDMSSGAWPAIWLVPGPDDPESDEVDLFEGGLTDYDSPNNNFSGFVHTSGKIAGLTLPTSVDLADGTHTYGMYWVPGKSVTWYLDGHEVQRVVSSQTRIPSNPMALVVDLQMASSGAASWHTVTSGSTPATLTILGMQYGKSIPKGTTAGSSVAPITTGQGKSL